MEFHNGANEIQYIFTSQQTSLKDLLIHMYLVHKFFWLRQITKRFHTTYITYLGEHDKYIKQTGYLCNFATSMLSQNLDDAMQECSSNAFCSIFCHGCGRTMGPFYSCESVTYEKHLTHAFYKQGNKTIFEFRYLSWRIIEFKYKKANEMLLKYHS